MLAIAKLPIGALERLSSRTSTRPLTPLAAPEAARAENWWAGLLPKSTLLNCSQSPSAIQPTSSPPSEQVSVWVPPCALALSASIVPYAVPPPPPGVVGGGVVGVVPPLDE